jgi:hypothetical protein
MNYLGRPGRWRSGERTRQDDRRRTRYTEEVSEPVPVDLILHTLRDDPLMSDVADVIDLAIDRRRLAEEWLGWGREDNAIWLRRRILGETPPRPVAADTRIMEVAVAQRLAATAIALLITQDYDDTLAARVLWQAAQRIVGLDTGPQP